MEVFEEYVNDCRDVISYYKRKYSYLGSEAQADIEQESLMAVNHAIGMYDANLGSFKNYASGWIRTYVYDYLNKVECVVPISREANRKVRLLKRLISENPNSSLAELSKMSGMSEGVVLDYMNGFNKTSLDTKLDEEGDRTLLDTIADEGGNTRAQIEERERLIESIKSILSPKEVEVLFSFFGIYPKKTQRELAAMLGISHQAVSKRINSIIKRLQEALKAECSLYHLYIGYLLSLKALKK